MSAPPRRALRLAHRGDWRHAPENSVAALLAALAIPNCDGLEFDVRVAADGVPILLHDETLERVQGRADRVDALTAHQLADHGIPTLREVLAAVGPEPFLDVELKGDPGTAPLDELAAARGPGLARAVVSSFEPDALERVAVARPSWPRWVNAEDLEPATLRRAGELGCVAISADVRAIDARSAAAVRRAGLGLAAWTVRRRPTAERLDRLGALAVCVEAAALDG